MENESAFHLSCRRIFVYGVFGQIMAEPFRHDPRNVVCHKDGNYSGAQIGCKIAFDNILKHIIRFVCGVITRKQTRGHIVKKRNIVVKNSLIAAQLVCLQGFQILESASDDGLQASTAYCFWFLWPAASAVHTALLKIKFVLCPCISFHIKTPNQK